MCVCVCVCVCVKIVSRDKILRFKNIFIVIIMKILLAIMDVLSTLLWLFSPQLGTVDLVLNCAVDWALKKIYLSICLFFFFFFLAVYLSV